MNIKSPSCNKLHFELNYFGSPNRFIWSNRLRNGCARPESIKQWLVTPSWITPPFWNLKKVTTIFCLGIDVPKSKVSNDWAENLLNYGTFVSGGHLEILRHFKVLAHEMTIALQFQFKKKKNPQFFQIHVFFAQKYGHRFFFFKKTA
jgi:hypothetical protein